MPKQVKQHPYRPVTPAILEELRTIVGEPHVIAGDPDRLHDYAHDESWGGYDLHMPEVVVKPCTAEEISTILKLANREHVPVTPRGAGSGLSGGAVPLYGGILLSVERMNRILEIDLENMMVVVEPGVITNDINEAVKEHNLFYAGYPMSVETCFIGGNIAENAGGGRAIKYGVTGRYVLGLEVVLPTGAIVQLGGKRVKDVTGYDLVHLMVGSEGTLGIFTRIILRLLPLPKVRATMLVPFADLRSAIAAVPRIVAEAHFLPSAIELMDALSVQAAYDFVNERPPQPNIGALLLIEVDAASPEEAEAQYSAAVDVCLAAGALDAYVADTPASQRKMWRPREKAAEALKLLAPDQAVEDIVLPPARIPDIVPELERIAQQYGVKLPCFGHAADGNLHVNIIKPAGMEIAAWRELLPSVLADIYAATARLGGTLSGEHGVGSKRARYLPLVLDPAVITLQTQIKRAFDPLNILNPGKIFPEG